MAGSTGYIRIQCFGDGTYESLCTALDFFGDRNIKNIVIDLRNNFGGNLRHAVLTAQRFVPKGIFAKLVSKSPAFKDKEYRSDLKCAKYKVAVLINGGTASSAEILAGAIQETCSGVLIGTNTYGKSDVMREFEILSYEAFVKAWEITGVRIADAAELRDKYGFSPTFDGIIGTAYISVARYVTPGGKLVDGIGLEPDIRMEDTEYVIQGELDNAIRQNINSLSGLAANDEHLLRAFEFFS